MVDRQPFEAYTAWLQDIDPEAASVVRGLAVRLFDGGPEGGEKPMALGVLVPRYADAADERSPRVFSFPSIEHDRRHGSESMARPSVASGTPPTWASAWGDSRYGPGRESIEVRRP